MTVFNDLPDSPCFTKKAGFPTTNTPDVKELSKTQKRLEKSRRKGPSSGRNQSTNFYLLPSFETFTLNDCQFDIVDFDISTDRLRN